MTRSLESFSGPERPSSTKVQRQLELIDGLGLDPDEELEVHTHAIEFDAPVHGREQLTIHVYGADVDRPDAPLLLFSHGGSVRPTPGLVGLGLPLLVAAARKAEIPLRFAALDHRGASSHEHKLDYCLADRVIDLEVAHEFVLAELGGHRRRLALMGTSMGGHVAAMASRSLDADMLLLSCPAAYSEEAHFARFGAPFTRALRRPKSWVHSPAFEAVAKHLEARGSIALRVSRFDQVIPGEVTARYRELVEQDGADGRVIETSSDHFSTTPSGMRALLDHVSALV